MKWNTKTSQWDKTVKGQQLSLASVPPDKEFMEKFASDEKEVIDWISQPVGELKNTLSAEDAIFGDSAFMGLIHRLQFEIARNQLRTPADISMSAPLDINSRLNAGTLRIRDMFNLYRYENYFYVMAMTGKQVKDTMEYSYGNWMDTMNSPNDHIIAFDKDKAGNLIFVDRYNSFATKVNPYNYDSFAGIIYTVDITKPVGSRITIKSMADGSAFSEAKTYNVAINSHRASGSGGHLTRGAGIPLETLESMRLVRAASDKDLRYYMIKWFETQRGIVTAEPMGNWEVIPKEYAEKGRETDYPLLYRK